MKNLDFLNNYNLNIDQVGLIERTNKFKTRSIKKESKMQALKMALSMIDLTTLEGKDTEKKVINLCSKAANLHIGEDLPNVAAICVYPAMVRTAKQFLESTDINVASVSTAFPSGQASFEVKQKDTEQALKNGADEIDMVISRGKFLEGDYQFVFEEIKAIKAICGKKKLKVIFETGELGNLDNVRLASLIAMHAGADFIKTSTGKISPAATMPVVLTMLESVRDFYFQTGVKVGVKPAGGISNAKTAIQYLVMVKETLGNDWLNSNLFRFGASSLANDVIRQILKQKTGNYQSSDYFSID